MSEAEQPKMTREDAILERMAGRYVEIPGEEPASGEEARENLGNLADEQAEAGEGHGGQTLPDGSTPTLGEAQVDPDLDLSDADNATGSDVTPGDTPEAVGVEAAKQTGAATGEAPPEGEAKAVDAAVAAREDGANEDDETKNPAEGKTVEEFKAAVGDLSDKELEAAASDDRQGVKDAVEAEQAKRADA